MLAQSTQEKQAGEIRAAKMKGTRHLTIVIKIGSSSIVDETTHQPILSILSLIVETATKLRRDGHRVVIVSSGAIAVGLQRMNIPKKPKHLPQIQVSNAMNFMLFSASPCWPSAICICHCYFLNIYVDLECLHQISNSYFRFLLSENLRNWTPHFKSKT